MAGEIKRSAGTAYIDLALGNVDRVIAQAHEVGRQVDHAINEEVSKSTTAETSSRNFAEGFTRGFRRTIPGFAKPIQDELGNVKDQAQKDAEEAAANFAKGFLAKVGPPIDRTFSTVFADLEGKSGATGRKSGESFTARFRNYFLGSFGRLKDDFKQLTNAAGGSGGDAGKSWGQKFFENARNQVQKLDKGIPGGLALGLAPLGVAGGAGALGVGLSVGSSLLGPAVGVLGGASLAKSYLSSASQGLTSIQSAGGNQAQIAADVSAQQAGLSGKAYRAQQAALKGLTADQLSLVKALGDTNTNYSTLTPAQAKALSQLQSGTTAYSTLLPAQKQAIASLTAQRNVYDRLDPATKGFVSGLASIKASDAGLKTALAPTYLKAFSSFVPFIQNALKLAQPVLEATGHAFGSIGAELTKLSIGSGAAAFFNKITAQINGGAIQKIASGIGRIAAGFADLWVKFGGSGKFISDFGSMTARFLAFAQSQNAGGSFSKFLDYLRQNGATLLQTISSIGHTITGVIGGLASAGTGDLSVLKDVLGFISKLPPGLAAPLAAVASQAVILQKLGGFKVISALTDIGNSEGAIRKTASAIADFSSAVASGISKTWDFVTSLNAAKIAEIAQAAAGKIATAAQWLWNFALDAFPVVLIISAIVALVAVIIKYHNQIWHFIIRIWNDIYGFLKHWWYVLVIGILTGGLGLIIGLVIKYHNQIWGFIKKIWGDISGFFSRTWDSIYNKVTGVAKNVWHDVVTTFTNLKNDLITVFKDIANASFVIPVNWVIDHVFNDGILKAWNWVGGLVGIKAISVPDIPKFATGGRVPGSGDGDTQPIWATPGEFVIRKAAAAALGPDFLEALNHADHYASGGLIGSIKSAGSSALKSLENATLGGLRDAVSGVLTPIVSSIPKSPGFFGILHSLGGKIESDILSFLELKDKAAGSLGGTIASAAHTLIIGQALKAAGVTPSSAWISGLNTLITRESGWNASAINLTDINAKNGDPSRGLAQVIAATFNAYHAPGTSFNIYDPIANIAAAIRYIVARYGVANDGSNLAARVQQANPKLPPKGYDKGGLLSPGYSSIYNGLGKPEAILTPDQWNSMARLASQGGETHIHVYIGNEEIDGHIDHRVDRAFDDLTAALSNGRAS